MAAVNVLSSETHQPIPFQSERLHASLGKAPLAITNLEKINGNRILILVDVSGTMSNKPLPEMLDSILQQAPPDSSFAYGFFSDEVLLSEGFSDADQLRKALRQIPGLEVKGRSRLYDALDRALKLFQGPNPGDSILLISDGQENSSKISSGAIKREMLESGVRLFGVIMPTVGSDAALPSRGTLPEEAYADLPDFRLLSELAEKSGGAIYPLTRWRGSVLQSIQKFWMEAVGGGYLMTINVPQEPVKPGAFTLRLDRSGDKGLRNGYVTYQQKLVSCSRQGRALH